MSEEPRIQLKDSGTVVSELWREQSSGDTIIETESGKQLRLKDADGTLEADALDTEREFTTSRNHDIIIHETADGTVVADGPNGDLGSGSAAESVVESVVTNNPAASVFLNDLTFNGTADIDLSNTRGLTLDGKITIGSSGIGYALKIQNGRDIDVNLEVDGNAKGQYKFIRDFAENTTGLDCVLYFRGTRNVTLSYNLYDYSARALEAKTESGPEPKTSKFTIQNFKTNACAQSCHIETANAFGQIDGAFLDSKQDGSYISSQDLTIGYFENILPSAANPVVLEGTTHHIDKMLLAGGSTPHLRVNTVSNLTADEIFVTGQGGGTGVEFVDCDRPDVTVRTTNCKGGYGVTVDGCKWGTIRHESDQDSRGVLITSATTRPCEKLTVDAEVYEADERAVSVADGGNGTHQNTTVEGFSHFANQTSTAGESDVMVDVVGHEVDLAGFVWESGNTDHYIDAPSGNNVRVLGGAMRGTVSFANQPRVIRDVDGYAIKDGGVATITSGTTSVTVNPNVDTPEVGNSDVYVFPAQPLGAASYWFLGGLGDGNASFDIKLDADPTQDVAFVWRVDTSATDQ